MKKVVYLSGCPRSMTTLMANIITNNPNIGGGETSALLEYIFGARGNYGSPENQASLTKEIMHESFLNFCRMGIQGYAKCVNEKKIYLDKSRGWVHYAPFLWEINPDAKIIVMVRDIRGVLSSLEKKWRENPSVLDSRENPAQLQFITVDQRVNHWVSEPPLGISLMRIFNAIQTKTIKNMHIVKAEDLCKNPKATMEKVYEFIEEPYFDLDYKNVAQMTVENDRVNAYGIYGDHKIRPDVQPLKNDYEEILTTAISNNIKANWKWFYEEFGYI